MDTEETVASKIFSIQETKSTVGKCSVTISILIHIIEKEDSISFHVPVSFRKLIHGL